MQTSNVLIFEVLFLGLSGGAAFQSSGASRKRVLLITLGFALPLLRALGWVKLYSPVHQTCYLMQC